MGSGKIKICNVPIILYVYTKQCMLTQPANLYGFFTYPLGFFLSILMTVRKN